jgi:hypothetical protein
MYQRINDLLDESSISYLSQQKYVMGLPGKVKGAILRFRKRIRSIRRDPVYKDILSFSSDSMKFFGKTLPQYGDVVTMGGELLSKFANPNPKYNPPLVDLDRFRIEFSKTRPYQSPVYEAAIIKAGLTRVLNKETGRWELFEQL